VSGFDDEPVFELDLEIGSDDFNERDNEFAGLGWEDVPRVRPVIGRRPEGPSDKELAHRSHVGKCGRSCEEA
jgi:hypothetical protein